jgi:hypothetical protein
MLKHNRTLISRAAVPRVVIRGNKKGAGSAAARTRGRGQPGPMPPGNFHASKRRKTKKIRAGKTAEASSSHNGQLRSKMAKISIWPSLTFPDF